MDRADAAGRNLEMLGPLGRPFELDPERATSCSSPAAMLCMPDYIFLFLDEERIRDTRHLVVIHYQLSG